MRYVQAGEALDDITWHPACLLDLSKAWAQAVELCPELCGKLQLETAVAGRQQSTAGLRVRLHLLSWTNALQHRQRRNFTALRLFRLARLARFRNQFQ